MSPPQVVGGDDVDASLRRLLQQVDGSGGLVVVTHAPEVAVCPHDGARVAPVPLEHGHDNGQRVHETAHDEEAFALGGGTYAAPVQRVEDFLQSKPSVRLGGVKPSIGPGYALSDLHTVLPEHIGESMKQAIVDFGRKLKGFDHPDAVLTGLETRSSSPIRILRDPKTLESVAVKGLYPCGEGAGYAGGIISAAVDGIKCAEMIIKDVGSQ